MEIYRLQVNSVNVSDRTDEVTWTSSSDSFSVELSFKSLYNLPLGAVVSLYLEGKEHFRGMILNKTDERFAYSYKCLDYSHYLKNEVVRQFKNMTASGAIGALLNDFGIKHQITSIPTRIKKIYVDQSIEEIMADILAQAEQDQQKIYIREMRGATVVIDELESFKIMPTFVLGDFSIESSMEDLRNKILVVSDNKVLASAEDKTSQGLYGLLQQIESLDKDEKARANAVANSTLKKLNKTKASTTIELTVISGAELIRANRKIQLTKGGLNGWYRITSATHTLSRGDYKVSINIEW